MSNKKKLKGFRRGPKIKMTPAMIELVKTNSEIDRVYRENEEKRAQQK